jgi:hypothetical protein
MLMRFQTLIIEIARTRSPTSVSEKAAPTRCQRGRRTPARDEAFA